MKINKFRGDLTDISAKEEALMPHGETDVLFISFWKFPRHFNTKPVHADFSSLLNLGIEEGENNVLYSVRISALDGKCNAGCSGVSAFTMC